MKNFVKVFCLIYFCTILKANAQNYLISFAGTGASTTVGTVKVENLMKGTSLTLNGGDVLHLTVLTGVNSIYSEQSTELRIYPNPMSGNTKVQVSPPAAGEAIISVTDMTGRLVIQTKSNLDIGLQEFRLSGLQSGLYLITIKGSSYQYSGKLLCSNRAVGTVSVEKIVNNQVVDATKSKKDSKGILVTVDMNYTIGDRLKFTGMSGNYSTVKTDIPTSSNMITFKFIGCTDRSSNNYPIVEIGDQVWMGENLKTTKYHNGDLIETTIPSDLDVSGEDMPKYQWAYNGDENNVSTYGRLYTWYAATDSRGICPSGWHVPGNSESDDLTNFLGGTSLSGDKLKETGIIHWKSPNTATNETGFTAVPGSERNNIGQFGGIGQSYYWWNYNSFNDAGGYFRLLSWESSGEGYGYAVNQSGMAIRCVLTKFGTVTDYEGNDYKTLQIGSQEWMVENLQSTKYNNGTSIPYIIEDIEWNDLSTPAYCWYLNDPVSYRATYGALYNWYAVSTGNLCPTGWHVPIRADWLDLIDYLGGDFAYDKLKSTTEWTYFQATNGTNDSGFNAYPGGYRNVPYGGYYLDMGADGNWWSAESYDANTVWSLGIGYASFGVTTTNAKGSGYSVRCIKN